ncbi:MAG: preprotein translocase subunit SecE [Paludibacteraceae bacterium]|jgi:preprotein translocase subunit SecE|nr:preprotein translocase subunit SecE [Paludibacteraceae bacterium]
MKTTDRIKNFFTESYSELVYKVSWPTKQELANSAVVVLVASLIIALIVWVIDMCFENLMQLIYSIL